LVAATEIELAPSEETQIYCVLTPSGSKRPSIKGKMRKYDSKIFIEMIPPSHREDQNEQQPVRELLVTAKICRSIMDLAQKSIF
jgi:hypothetical protein